MGQETISNVVRFTCDECGESVEKDGVWPEGWGSDNYSVQDVEGVHPAKPRTLCPVHLNAALQRVVIYNMGTEVLVDEDA